MKLNDYNALKIYARGATDHLFQRTKKTALLLLLFSLFLNARSQNALVSFKFKLNASAKTSAGVYKKDGTLIRTLWGGVNYPAGTFTKTWDRKDDYGRLVTDTGLIVKVLSNNVKYEWEGVIGNTSDSTHGISVIHSYYRMEGMAISGNTAYFSTGYSEGTTATNKFLLSQPQNNIPIMYQQYGTNLVVNYVATDGTYVYWSGYDPYGGQYQSPAPVSLTYATAVSNDAEVLFSAGNPVQMGTGRQYKKAIDTILNNGALGNPTGLAVQKNGKYLFISHGGLNSIHVLNKTNGAYVTSISITNPRELCVDANDNLWVISGTNTVKKYAIDTATGTFTGSALVSLSGLVDPLNIEVSPNNYMVAVIDGGASQQVKFFSNASGVAIRTLGQYGGYATDPLVANDKFYFTDSVTQMRNQFIAFQADSSFWISDGGNERVQHFTSSGTYINNIMYMPATYSTQVDRNDPTRAFNEFLEFKIDYSKPLAPNNGSWKLYKNWKHGVPATHRDKTYNAYIFQNVVTLSNGRTYATLYNASNPNLRCPEIVELPSSGHVRLTGYKFGAYSDELIETDGSRRCYSRAGNADTGFWKTKQLTGFDSVYNPVWGSETKIASVYASEPNDPSYDPIYGALSYAVKTSSDILVVFNHSLKGGYHLGGVKAGDNKFLWKSAMATYAESAPNAGDQYKGEYPSDGSYDIGNDVKIGGSHAYTVDRNIFWNYHGEFWGGGQTNKWNHVYDDGLLISQFGITTADARLIDWDAPPMLAGNVFASTVVKVGSDLYVYHNDEAVHSGLHRWKITGLSTIQEQTATLSYTTATGGLTGSYFDGKLLNSFNRKTTRVDASVNFATPPSTIRNTSSYSTRWTGFVQPVYTESYTFYTNVTGGVKLWVDGNLIIDQWTATASTEYTSSTIKLAAGKKYTVKMEINTGAAGLSWSSASQSKQVIPTSALYPAEFPDYTADGTDLMEGLGFRTVLQDGMYGWNRTSASESSDWHVQTNIRSFQRENPDVLIRFSNTTGTSSVTRDLGKVVPCLTQWTVAGDLSYAGNDPNFLNNNFGGYFDILDANGKVISRITNERQWTGNNPTSVKINGVEVVKYPANVMALISNKFQPFSITVDANGVKFTYGDFAPVTTSVFDNTSNWKQPAQIKFHFTTSTVYPNTFKAICVQKFRFFTVAPSLPQITVAGPGKLCQGDSVTLTASAASSYLWNNSATTQSITVKNNGNYSVVVKDANGCPLSSDTLKMAFKALPKASITASGPTTLCQGDSVTLTASASVSYFWNNNASTQSIKVKNTGNFTVKVTDSNTCSALSPVTSVSVTTTPTATITASGSTTFCQGDSVTLTANTANSYLWSNNATTQSIKVKSSGNFSVKVSNSSSCFATSSITPVTVNALPNASITAAGATTFCQGDSVTLTASTASSYLWSNNATTQSIRVKNSGSFKVKITNANGCTNTSANTAVTVNPLPNASITASSATTFCQGDSVTLTSGSASAYLWSNNATSQSIRVKNTGNYKVKVTDANACSNTSSNTSVTVNALPTASITTSGATTFCQGDSVTLTAGSAASYLWSNNATTQSIRVKNTGNYKVKVTDANACSNTSSGTSVTVNALPTASITASGATTFCQGDSVTLTAGSASSYLWSNNATTQSIRVKNSGNYKVKVMDANACSSASSNTAVTVNALPTASITASGTTTFCQGDSVTLTAITASAYLWNNNATTQSIRVKNSGNYKVKVTDANTCSNTSANTSVTVNALPTASITASSATTFCQGDSVTLTAGSAASYLWSNSATTQSIRVKNTGNYKVKVTDANACSNTSSNTSVTVNALPTANITASGTTTFCQGDSVTLTAGSASAYLWNNNATTQSIRVKNSGNYKVKVTDANTCSNTSANTSVTVNALPTASITASSATTFCQGDSVTLTAGSAASYLWSNNATTQSIRVKNTGNYKVKVTDANTCSNTSSNTSVTVNALPTANITASSTTTFCQGDSVTLTAGSATAYLWSNNATTQNIKVKSSGNFTVKITDANACSGISSALPVTVNPLPSASVSAMGSTTICQGDSVILNASSAKSYLWNNSATSQSIRVRSGGNYKVQVKDNNGCSATSGSIPVTVNTLPNADISISGPTTFCSGDSVTLSVVSAKSYLWNTGETTQTIRVKTSGNFTVKVTGSNGCSATSAGRSVTVNALPNAMISSTGSVNFCNGDSVILTATANNSYSWSNSATTRSITVKNTGTYTVTVGDNNGCSAQSAPVSVNANYTPLAEITANRSPNLCKGDSIMLIASAAKTFLWNTGDTTPFIIVSTAGNYTVKITDGNGCSANSPAIKVRVNALPSKPIITAGSSTTFCEGDSVLLTSSIANAYFWNNNQKTRTVTIFSAGEYNVKITDANGCSAVSDNMSVFTMSTPVTPTITTKGNILTSSALNGNQWYFNDVAIPGATGQTYKKTRNGKYSVKVTNGNCISASSSYALTADTTATPGSSGLDDLNIQFSFNVYPNPNSGRFVLSSDDITEGTIRIYDITGKIIYNESGVINRTIDLSGAAYGIYSIEIRTERSFSVKRITIQ